MRADRDKRQPAEINPKKTRTFTARRAHAGRRRRAPSHAHTGRAWHPARTSIAHKIGRRWADSIATTPEQAYTEVAALVPETITRDELRAILERAWTLASTVERRVERHNEKERQKKAETKV